MRETATSVCGIAYSTFFYWKKQGEAGREPFKSFIEDLVRAEAECEAKHVKIISDAAETNWKAAALLRWPERWSYHRRVQAMIKNSVTINDEAEAEKLVKAARRDPEILDLLAQLEDRIKAAVPEGA